jgi:glycosyltransferase involved in cell wall biosynthesis
MNKTKDNTNPMVTVAMVTYNSSKYVRTAIDSVLASSYINFELIISDDCSTDNTWNIIQEYKDFRIKATQNIPNIGEYNNRNKCIDLATGKYIIFIDGDDYIYPHGIKHFLKGALLDKNAAMVISRPESDHMIYPVVLSSHQTFKYDYLGHSITDQGFPSTLFKTYILKKHGLTTEYVSGDTYLKKELAYQYPTTLIHSGLAWWRRTPGQASERLFKTSIGIMESTKMKLHFLNKHHNILDNSEKQEALKRIYKPLFRTFIKSCLLFKVNNLYLISRSFNLLQIAKLGMVKHNTSKFSIATPTKPAHHE